MFVERIGDVPDLREPLRPRADEGGVLSEVGDLVHKALRLAEVQVGGYVGVSQVNLFFNAQKILLKTTCGNCTPVLRRCQV